MTRTLGDYRKLMVELFGDKSAAVKFLDEKIKAAPEGQNAKVLADESQTLYALS